MPDASKEYRFPINRNEIPKTEREILPFLQRTSGPRPCGGNCPDDRDEINFIRITETEELDQQLSNEGGGGGRGETILLRSKGDGDKRGPLIVGLLEVNPFIV